MRRIGGCCAPALLATLIGLPVLLQFLHRLREDMGGV
jgi:hypothetical protein